MGRERGGGGATCHRRLGRGGAMPVTRFNRQVLNLLNLPHVCNSVIILNDVILAMMVCNVQLNNSSRC